MDSLLRVEHVTISYNGKPVVQDVSFELKQGEILENTLPALRPSSADRMQPG